MVSRDGMLDSLVTDEAKSQKTCLPFSAALHSRAIKKSNFVIMLLAMHGSFSGLSCSFEAKKRVLGFYHIFRVKRMTITLSTSLPIFVSMSLLKKNG